MERNKGQDVAKDFLKAEAAMVTVPAMLLYMFIRLFV